MKHTAPQRVFGLDLYRAAAILLVVNGHAGYWLANTPLAGFPFVRLVDGVDLFFVLSGFLIGGILLRELGTSQSFTGADLLHFWKRRWFRTLPNYYLVLALNCLLTWSAGIGGDFDKFSWRFLLFLQNFSQPFDGFFWESWSLSVEEWFYLVFPVLVLLLRKAMMPKRAYLAAVVIMLVFPLAYRLHLYTPAMDDFSFDFRLRKIVLTRLDSIGYGLLAAYFYQQFTGFWHRWRWPAFLLGAVGVGAMINIHPSLSSVYAQVFFFPLISIGMMLWLPLATALPAPGGFFERAIVHVSKISYSMYLLNLGVVLALMVRYLPPSSVPERLSLCILYWAVVVGASTLLYRFFEKPVMDLRDR